MKAREVVGWGVVVAPFVGLLAWCFALSVSSTFIGLGFLAVVMVCAALGRWIMGD